MINDKTFETTTFLQAAFFYARGVPYVRTYWPTSQQAVFVFKQPLDDILSAWQTNDMVSAKGLQSAMDFLRDELRRTRE